MEDGTPDIRQKSMIFNVMGQKGYGRNRWRSRLRDGWNFERCHIVQKVYYFANIQAK